MAAIKPFIFTMGPSKDLEAYKVFEIPCEYVNSITIKNVAAVIPEEKPTKTFVLAVNGAGKEVIPILIMTGNCNVQLDLDLYKYYRYLGMAFFIMEAKQFETSKERNPTKSFNGRVTMILEIDGKNFR